MKFVFLGTHGDKQEGFLVRNRHEETLSLEVSPKAVEQYGSPEKAFEAASRYSGIDLKQFRSSSGQLKYSQAGPFNRYVCGVVQ